MAGAGLGVRGIVRTLKHGDNVAAVSRLRGMRGIKSGADEVAPSPAPARAASKEPSPFTNVNPSGSTTNCVDCVIALDETLAGRPTLAAAGPPRSALVLSRHYNGVFQQATSEQITGLLSDAGPGARLIVLASPPPSDTVAHTFLGVNQGGKIRFIDGQIGMPAVTIMAKDRSFWYLWTNVP